MKNNIYIYLARLDKKGIKVLSAFEYHKKVYPTKITNIGELNLKKDISNIVSKQAYENRMHFELYAESADSFNELKLSLSQRGYSNLPIQQFTGYTNNTKINEKYLITNSSTMFRKKSEVRQ